MNIHSDPGAQVFVAQSADPITSLLATYRKTGVAVIPGLFAETELADFRKEATRLQKAAQDQQIDPKALANRTTVDGGELFERIDPLLPFSKSFAALGDDGRLLTPVKAILECAAPFLLKEKLIYKFPTDRGYLLHQDFPYYARPENEAGKIMTVALTLDPIIRENGGLTFYLGCHDRLQPAPASDPRDVDPAAMAGMPAWDGIAPAGSLIFFHSLVPHQSGPNLSDAPRRILYYTYVTPDLGHLRQAYYEERQRGL